MAANSLVGSLVGTIRRLFRLWWIYAYLDFAWVSRDLKQVLVYLLSDLIVSIAGITGLFLLAERFDGIGPWTKDQVIFMLGYATVVRGVLDALFGYNVAMISRRLGRGQFDHTLIQPQPVWMALLTDGFTPFTGSLSFLAGLGLMGWTMGRVAPVITFAWLALLALHIVASVAILVSFSFVWGSLAFWAPRAAEEISSSAMEMMGQLKPFPLDGLGPALLGGLMTLLPAGFVAWYPSRVLLGLEPATYGIAITPVAAIVFSLLSVWVFTKGMKHYGRVGSQRYLSLGHRR